MNTKNKMNKMGSFGQFLKFAKKLIFAIFAIVTVWISLDTECEVVEHCFKLLGTLEGGFCPTILLGFFRKPCGSLI